LKLITDIKSSVTTAPFKLRKQNPQSSRHSTVFMWQQFSAFVQFHDGICTVSTRCHTELQ